MYCILKFDPGSGMGKMSRSGSGIWIRDEQPGSYFLELRNHYWGLKYLISLRIRDGKISDPKAGMGKIRFRDPDKHPESEH
jgi:hypothetical protein